MSLESNPDQAFLGAPADNDLATLDSMDFTGTQSQFGVNAMATGSSGSNNTGMPGQEGGFSGVSGSLFDRIRARTAEQQNPSTVSPPTPSPPVSQQPSSEPTMEIENQNAFDAAVAGASVGAAFQNQGPPANTNETTYAFAAAAGEDFSAAVPHVPQYGPSRDDPYYAASSSNPQQHYAASIQDKTALALEQTGNTIKSIFGAGLNGARAVGALAQDKMARGRGGGGDRSYSNNFLIREDTVERGGAPPTNAPPPPVAGPFGSPQAGTYSMLSYGKTFCEDLFMFVKQLPLAVRVAAAVLVPGYVIYRIVHK